MDSQCVYGKTMKLNPLISEKQEPIWEIWHDKSDASEWSCQISPMAPCFSDINGFNFLAFPYTLPLTTMLREGIYALRIHSVNLSLALQIQLTASFTHSIIRLTANLFGKQSITVKHSDAFVWLFAPTLIWFPHIRDGATTTVSIEGAIYPSQITMTVSSEANPMAITPCTMFPE